MSCIASRLSIVACVVSLAACGDDHSAVMQPTPRLPGLATTLTLLSGDGQTGTVGDSISQPVRLLARDSAGLPVPNVTVVVIHIPGRFQIGAATTDSSGIASVRFRLDTIPGVSLDTAFAFRGPVVPRTLPATGFRVTAIAGAPASIVVNYPPTRTNPPLLGFGEENVPPPTFLVLDRFKNPVPGVTVTFRTSPDGAVTPPSQITDSAGAATPRTWTLGAAAATYQLVATAGTASATATAQALSGPPVKIVVVSGDKQQVAAGGVVPGPIRVQVLDAAGMPVYDAPVTFTDQSTGFQCSVSANSGGAATLDPNDAFSPTCRWRLPTQPGVHTLNIASGAASAAATATVVEMPASLNVVSGPPSNSPFAAGATPSVVVRLTLPSGAPAIGYSLSVASRDPSTFFFTHTDSTTTDTLGLAAVTWRLPRAVGLDTLTISVTAYPQVRQVLTAAVVGSVRFFSIAAGDAHTCATTWNGPLLATAPVFCWGRNSEGQLGDGTTVPRSTPTVVAIPSAILLYTGLITAGAGHSCVEFYQIGFIGGFNELYPSHGVCWGSNAFGQVGATPNGGATVIDLGSTLATPAAGTTHTCAVHFAFMVDGPSITRSGVACWGDNRIGQLGDGSTVAHSVPTLIDTTVTGGNFFSLGAGDGFTCGIAGAGKAFCWGRNADGQLGDQTSSDRTTPVPVSGGITFSTMSAGPSSHTLPLAVGRAHACALTPDGLAYCWGRNDSGQLGDGTTISRSTPVPVIGGLRFTSIAAGGAHTCALTSTGAAYCWGANASGELGNAGTSSVAQPTAVSGGLSFSVIAAGKSHTCALLRADGTAYCWGLNSDGQLGDGTTVSRPVPARVADFRPY